MEFISKIKKSLKSTFKSVIFNFKEFVCIYVAIVIVQLLFGVWALSTYTNYYANDGMFDEQYAHDIVIKGSNQNLTNLENKISYDISQGSAIVENVVSYRGEIGVNLKGGQLESFKKEYLDEIILEIDYSVTPKYVYHSEIRGEIIASSVILGATALIIGILILSVMYSVRTNQYKYQYGLFMTFGADKRMLGRIAMSELLAINTVTILPSALISYLLSLIVYAGSGVSVIVTFVQFLIYVLASYLAVTVAACISLGDLFGKTPIALITTADNSNFVSSPRRSFHLFGKKMPLKYEGYSAWRFRKYIARLVLGATLFSVVFVTGIYSANMIKSENSVPSEEFIVDFKYYVKDPKHRERANKEATQLLPALLEIENVERVTFEQSESLSERMDHILITPGTELTGANATVPYIKKEGYSRATNKCRYVCVDALALKNYESVSTVEYLDGYDAESILENENFVIVSESLYGARAFSFKAGDKITVAIKKSVNGKLLPESDPMKFLRQQLDNCSFTYKEYTIGAVIHDNGVEDSIIVGMNADAYREVTGSERVIETLQVYVSPHLELDEITKLREDVKAVVSGFEAWSYSSTDRAVYAIVDDRIGLPSLIYLMSILVLMIAPVVWIFSQIMFYKKREPEFRTLTSIGATMKEILGIHLVSGCIIFVISFIANFLISRLVCFGIYRIFTNLLPRLGVLGPSASFDSFVPVSVLLICAAVSALCGCVSSIVPFILYKNKLKREQNDLEKQSIEPLS